MLCPKTQINKQTYLLTCVDRFSQWYEALPMPSMSAYTTVRTFLARWVARYGVPERVMTDRGRLFESEIFWKLLQLLGTKYIHTTAYYLQANSMVERLHHSLNVSLHAELTSSKWLEHQPLIFLELRITVKKELNCSAAEALYETTLRLPAQYFLDIPNPPNKKLWIWHPSLIDFLVKMSDMASSPAGKIRRDKEYVPNS